MQNGGELSATAGSAPLAGELDDASVGPADPLARGDKALAALLEEAVLLVADEPLPIRKLVQAAGIRGCDRRHATAFSEEAATTLRCTTAPRSNWRNLAGGFQLLTRPEYHRWLTSVRRSQQDVRLTGPGRETLAIIAYRQPIMRADVEAIRGVHFGEVLRLLMEKGLVKIVGRDDSLGRPVLYGTTKKFLQVFGLKSLKELPNAERMRRRMPK